MIPAGQTIDRCIRYSIDLPGTCLGILLSSWKLSGGLATESSGTFNLHIQQILR